MADESADGVPRGEMYPRDVIEQQEPCGACVRGCQMWRRADISPSGVKSVGRRSGGYYRGRRECPEDSLCVAVY